MIREEALKGSLVWLALAGTYIVVVVTWLTEVEGRHRYHEKLPPDTFGRTLQLAMKQFIATIAQFVMYLTAKK